MSFDQVKNTMAVDVSATPNLWMLPSVLSIILKLKIEKGCILEFLEPIEDAH